MTDREMLLMAYGGLKAINYSSSQGLVLMLETHLYPPPSLKVSLAPGLNEALNKEQATLKSFDRSGPLSSDGDLPAKVLHKGRRDSHD